MKRKCLFRVAVATWLYGALWALANAQPYPNKAIKIVVPYAAGTASDTVGRMVAQHLADALKQAVIVENKAGANGAIGANLVAKSAPDGYTLLFTTNTTQAANPSLMKSLPYKPATDFVPISLIGKGVFLLAAHPDAPYNTLSQFLAYAKANPGKISYATANSSGIVSGAMLGLNGGIDWVHVPYKSGPAAITDVIGGQVSTLFVDLQSGLPHVKSGKLKGIAVTSAKASPLLPGPAPLSSAPGMSSFDLSYWMAMYAPASTPASIVENLNKEIIRFTEKPEVIKKFAELGFAIAGSSPAELGQFTASETQKWKSLIEAAGITPE